MIWLNQISALGFLSLKFHFLFYNSTIFIGVLKIRRVHARRGGIRCTVFHRDGSCSLFEIVNPPVENDRCSCVKREPGPWIVLRYTFTRLICVLFRNRAFKWIRRQIDRYRSDVNDARLKMSLGYWKASKFRWIERRRRGTVCFARSFRR